MKASGLGFENGDCNGDRKCNFFLLRSLNFELWNAPNHILVNEGRLHLYMALDNLRKFDVRSVGFSQYHTLHLRWRKCASHFDIVTVALNLEVPVHGHTAKRGTMCHCIPCPIPKPSPPRIWSSFFQGHGIDHTEASTVSFLCGERRNPKVTRPIKILVTGTGMLVFRRPIPLGLIKLGDGSSGSLCMFLIPTRLWLFECWSLRKYLSVLAHH